MSRDNGRQYRRIVDAFFGSYWAIQESKLEAIVDFLELKARKGAMFSAEEIAARIGARKDADVVLAANAANQAMAGAGRTVVAVLPIYGIISQRVSNMDDISGPGGTSTERVSRAFRAAMADPSVSAVVLDIDSPGGTVYGVEELATEIYKARGGKPIVAVADSLAASAAYWIATAADEIVVTPSGEVGSIGVFAEHTDVSEWLAKEGVKPTLISAGKFKVEGNPYEPIGDEARSYMQSRVDEYYSAFTRSVAKARGVAVSDVRSGFGQGRVVGADEAVKLGMADRVDTLDATIARMTRSKPKSGLSAAAAVADLSASIPAEIQLTPEEERVLLYGDGSPQPAGILEVGMTSVEPDESYDWLEL